jgi:hypothetical protein
VLIILVLRQTKLQLEAFHSLHNRVQEDFVNKMPPHILGNHTSSLHVLPENIWSGMSSIQVQERLKTGAIIIENATAPLFSFDRELFAEMLGHGDLQHVVPMEGELLHQLKRFIFDKFYIQISLWKGEEGLFLWSCSLC